MLSATNHPIENVTLTLYTHTKQGGEKTITPISCNYLVTKDICCESPYMCLKCSYCNVSVQLPYEHSQDGDFVRNIIDEVLQSHKHDEIDEILEINNKAIILTKTEAPYSWKIYPTCKICNNRVIMYIGDRIQISELVKCINNHFKYKHHNTMSLCSANNTMSLCSVVKPYNRNETARLFYDILSRAIAKITTKPVLWQQRSDDKYVNILFNSDYSSDCGKCIMAECNVCGCKTKMAKRSWNNLYSNSVRHHFGKKIVQKNYLDFVFAGEGKKSPALCVICGESYDTNINKVNEQLVLFHFQKCMAANKQYIKETGQTC